MLDGADVATEGDANGDRQRDPGTISVLGDVADDLLERRVNKAVELDLRNGPEAAQCQAHRDADDGRLGQWRVEDALFAEGLLQSVGDPKDAAERAHVLAKDEDVVVAGQRIA